MTKVLVVEDDPATQLIVQKCLERLGYQVTGCVSSAVEAIRAMEVTKPDVALVDVELSGAMDGIEAAELFTERFGLPVVFMTAHSDLETLERAKLTDPSGYVVKPVEERQLFTALQLATYRFKMERELSEREIWFRAMLSGLSEGVVATDPDGRVNFVNATAAELLGVEVASSLERPIGEVMRVVAEAAGGLAEDPLGAVLRTGSNYAHRTIPILASGRVRMVEVSGRLIRDASMRTLGAMLVIRDVSERSRADEAMRLAAKMQAVGTLASGVAHHFNNALQIVLGHAELIATTVDAGDPVCASAEAIRRTGKRSTELVRQLLTFSHVDRPSPDPLRVSELVTELSALIRTVVPTSIRFAPPTEVPEAYFQVSRKEFEQAVLHLVENARDAMPQGGELKLTIERRVSARPEIAIGVTDTGRGLTPEVRSHLFEPFFTTKEPGQGTGLGLSSVFMTAQRHGGTVEVDSEPGHGATFRIVVPEVPEPSRVESAKPATLNSMSLDRSGKALQLARGDETILLVEDEEDVRILIATALKNLGYALIEACGSQEALEAVENFAAPIHMVLTDLVMPGINGYELASRIERMRPGVKVLFMSAYDEEFTATYLKPGEAQLHLKKPFRIETLAWKVRRALSGF